ncbi:MAG: helix-turn-helix transcriptional regulator [Terricaulis sp.]
MSQEKLADILGVTFQHVQKYEKGVNRIAASRLFDIAAALEMPVARFFDGLHPNEADGGDQERSAEHEVLATPKARSLPPCLARSAAQNCASGWCIWYAL